MKDFSKILKSLFTGRKYTKGNFTYKVMDVEKLEDGVFYFTFDVLMPEDHSYWEDVFILDVEEIVENAYKYISQTFAYSLEFYVNGKKSQFYHINDSDRDEIIRRANQIDMVGFKVSDSDISYDMEIVWAEKIRKQYQITANELYLNFYFDYHINNIKVNGEPFEPKVEKVNRTAAAFDEQLDDNLFHEELESVIYSVLYTKLGIGEYELFLNSIGNVTEVNGIEVIKVKDGSDSPT